MPQHYKCVNALSSVAGMLHAARQHMGVKVNKSLKLFHADGLDFIRSDFDTSNPSTHSYDVIMLDVAVSAKVRHLFSLRQN